MLVSGPARVTVTPSTFPPYVITHGAHHAGLWVGGPMQMDQAVFAQNVQHLDGRPYLIDSVFMCDECGKKVRLYLSSDGGTIYAWGP